MPRPRTRSDGDILEAALAILHQRGPEALTFQSVAAASGLSPATLVQRFKDMAGLRRSTLLHAWDQLDLRTERLAAKTAKTPAGAIKLLAALSKDYGGIESYAEGLLVLREDLRDPILRARGAAWKSALCRALEECFASVPSAPKGMGLMMASQWQGALLWWSFDPRGKLEHHVEESLRHFVATLAGVVVGGA